MCSDCSQLITAFVRANVESMTATDVYRFASDLRRDMPELCEEDIVALIDAAVIRTWGAAALWDRRSATLPAAPPSESDGGDATRR